MKRSILLLIALCAITVLGFAQNNSFSEERTIGSFNSISVCCGIKVYVTEGTSTTLKIETNEKEALPYIKTEVKGSKLKISIERNKSFRNLKVDIYLSASNLAYVSASSASGVYSVTDLNTGNIELSASSSARIDLSLVAKEIECEVSSSGSIELKGSAVSADLDASSSGKINMENVTLSKVNADASSSGRIVVNVTDELHADASSSGSIIYSGTPKTVVEKTSSAGRVRAK